jgi:hypothetical protein
MQPCPPRPELERLLARQINDPERAALERHVEGCAACQEALEGLTRSPDVEDWQRLHRDDAATCPPQAGTFLRRLRQVPPRPDRPGGTLDRAGESSVEDEPPAGGNGLPS